MIVISTKGRYALRIMVELAESDNKNFVPLKELANNQNISLKYAENIMTMLSKNSLVDAIQGKGGGYKLNRDSKNYTIGDILRITEGELVPICNNKPDCERKSFCKTIKLWQDFNNIVNNYFDSITLFDLVKNDKFI